MHQSNPNPEVIDPADTQTKPIEQASMATMDRTQHMQLIQTARAFPRDIRKSVHNSIEMATLNEAIALECCYAIPRKGEKPVEGPTVRLAEIIAHNWTNMATEAYLVAEEKWFVVARANVCDLETNVTIGVEARRTLRKSDGTRVKDHMVGPTAQAAIAVAFRNAVFKCVPFPAWHDVYFAAKKKAVGDQSTLEQNRQKMLLYATKQGVAHDRLFAALRVTSIEEIDLEKLFLAKGAFQAIKDNEITIDEAFPPLGGQVAQEPAEDKARGDELADRIRKAREKKQQEPAAESEEDSFDPSDLDLPDTD